MLRASKPGKLGFQEIWNICFVACSDDAVDLLEPKGRLIVCGESRLDDEGAAYLQRLNERFRLPIAYEHIIAMES